jgi:hypothetical protein
MCDFQTYPSWENLLRKEHLGTYILHILLSLVQLHVAEAEKLSHHGLLTLRHLELDCQHLNTWSLRLSTLKHSDSPHSRLGQSFLPAKMISVGSSILLAACLSSSGLICISSLISDFSRQLAKHVLATMHWLTFLCPLRTMMTTTSSLCGKSGWS